MANDKNELLKLGGLWKNKDKNGKDYLSGNFTPFTKLQIFENSYKKNSSDPDYVMRLVANKKGESKNDDIPF
tara:strand:+ start:83 stop:298 length:216 start_codon:yes stop_codon:yes gene_type:complete